MHVDIGAWRFKYERLHAMYERLQVLTLTL